MAKTKQINKETKSINSLSIDMIDVEHIKVLLNNKTSLLSFCTKITSFPRLKANYYEAIKNYKTSAITNNIDITKKQEKEYKEKAKVNLIKNEKELKKFWSKVVLAKKQELETINKQYTNKKSKEYLDAKSTLLNNFQLINENVNLYGAKIHKTFNCDLLAYENMERKPILFVRNLTKYYKNKKTSTIDCLNFDIYPGEFHAFIGANGAGKTTTIKTLITSYHQWSGTILINGIPNEKEDAKKKIGYIPEKAIFPERMSTFNYLKWMIMLSNFSAKEAEKIVEAKLKDLGMWDLRKRSPNTFSSGQKKKVLLAQALTHNPDIIIMDEPVANLDPKARIEFFDQLLELKKQGKAIFISSHVLAELDHYADSLTILDGGKIIYSGDKDSLLAKYSKDECLVSFNKNDLSKVLKYFDKQKIKYRKSIEKPDDYIIAISKKNSVSSIQAWCAKNKITFEKFEWHEPTLEDIYKNMVVLGSKDTMIESNKIDVSKK